MLQDHIRQEAQTIFQQEAQQAARQAHYEALWDANKELFEKYKGNFTVTPPSIALNEGFDRINDGVYR